MVEYVKRPAVIKTETTKRNYNIEKARKQLDEASTALDRGNNKKKLQRTRTPPPRARAPRLCYAETTKRNYNAKGRKRIKKRKRKRRGNNKKKLQRV